MHDKQRPQFGPLLFCIKGVRIIKKVLFICSLLFVIIIAVGIYLVSKTESAKQVNLMRSFLNTYYTVEGIELQSPFDDPGDLENIEKLYESLFQDKYSTFLTRECFDKLVASRFIHYPEQISKEFDCSLRFSRVELKRTTDSWEGNPTYSYKAYIRAGFANKKSQKLFETGSIILNKVNDKWIISSFNKRRELYSDIKNLNSGL